MTNLFERMSVEYRNTHAFGEAQAMKLSVNLPSEYLGICQTKELLGKYKFEMMSP